MPKMNLSDTAIRKAKLPDSGAIELNDTDAPGLICRVTAGGAKTMAVKGRIKDGNTFRMSLGEFSLQSINEWRKQARDIMLIAKSGADPRRKPVDDITFAKARDLYLKTPRHVSSGPRAGQLWSTAHKREVTRYLNRECSKLEPMKLRQIMTADVASTVNKIETIAKRRALYDATSAFLSWCAEQHYITISPVITMKAPPTAPSRDRELTEPELKAVMTATGVMGYPSGHMYRLVLLTGKRKSEVAKMRWADLDLDDARWSIQANQTKSGNAFIEPLSRQGVELLKNCPQSGPYVFSTNGKTPVSGFGKFEKRLYLLSGNNGDNTWHVHDFRRSFASTAARVFHSPLAVADRALNHAGGARGVARVYQKYDLLAERAELTQLWADWLYDETPAENVVQLHG
jgi:integrase